MFRMMNGQFGWPWAETRRGQVSSPPYGCIMYSRWMFVELQMSEYDELMIKSNGVQFNRLWAIKIRRNLCRQANTMKYIMSLHSLAQDLTSASTQKI